MKKFTKGKILIIILVIASLITSIIITQISPFAASSNYNYGEALQKGIMFYEFQRSGKLPDDKRDNWRGDSGLNDGSDVGKDLTGGWYDAGDHVKFNLPMSYTSAMLAWSLYENPSAYSKSGQTKYITDAIKWSNDYLVKCHTGTNEYYYQVGDGGKDHSWWGPAECMQMERPSFKVTSSSPGSTVVGETAASLAVASIVLKNSDSTRSATYLKHAKELYTFAETTKSDKGYTAASGYYQSWSGFYDELSWAAAWLYLATNDETYLSKAESYVANWEVEPQTTTIKYKWAHCWDDVHYGAQLLLARITGKSSYKESVERSLDYWTTGSDGNKIKYTPKGLAWMDTWGSLRYSTTMAFIADLYASSSVCNSSKVSTYQNFAKSQIDYALGSTGRSFVIGFGTNPPERPHHRTAHSSWSDQQTTPDYHRHSLIGALVGGPDASDKYTDSIADFTANEVACDYNAGFVALLAREYEKYGGNPISNLTAIETPTNDEFFVEAGINASSDNFLEIKAYINNRSGWPARVGDKLSFKYFIDLSEFFAAGYTEKDLTIKTNYNGGAKVTGPIAYNASKNIYYVNVDFSGTLIYPGGQSQYKKEIQFRMEAPQNSKFWDNSNDYSFVDVKGNSSGSVKQTKYIPVYDDGKLVYGVEPGGATVTSTPTKTFTPTSSPTTSKPSVKKGDMNGDLNVTSTDAALIERYILGIIDTLTDAQKKAADINEDGKINSTDASLVGRYILGAIESL